MLAQWVVLSGILYSGTDRLASGPGESWCREGFLSQTNYPINFTSAICLCRLAHHFMVGWGHIMSAVSTPSHVPPSWGVVKLYVRGVRELSIPIFSPITFVNAGVLGIYYRYNSMTVETFGNSNASLPPAFVLPFFPSLSTLARFPLPPSLAHHASIPE